MQKATLTATTEGRWKAVVAEFLGCVASSLAENAMRINETAVMRKQKTMFPAVSIRALPAGKRCGLT